MLTSISGAIAGDTNLVAMFRMPTRISGAVTGDTNLVATFRNTNKVLVHSPWLFSVLSHFLSDCLDLGLPLLGFDLMLFLVQLLVYLIQDSDAPLLNPIIVIGLLIDCAGWRILHDEGASWDHHTWSLCDS